MGAKIMLVASNVVPVEKLSQVGAQSNHVTFKEIEEVAK